MSQIDLTDEQRLIAEHVTGVFVEACPGSGKTRTVVARVARIASILPPRKGIAILSFTNSAVEEFISRCHLRGINAFNHPSFIGTFDSFLFRFFISPSGLVDISERPIIVDSWKTLGIEIRLKGINSFRGAGVTLDMFDAATDKIDHLKVSHSGLRKHVLDHQEAYESAAKRRRKGLLRLGYLSAADARVEALQRLNNPEWSNALGSALAARFKEIIVDEAQDCNPLDLRILEWLRKHGVNVSIFADPDQAIYGFRYGNPCELLSFSKSYGVTNCLRLTGNFRSTHSICALAASLRARENPDEAIGNTAKINIPIHILTYHGVSVPKEISTWFLQVVKENNIQTADAIILAHGRRVARRACGLTDVTDTGGDSKVAKIASVVGEFNSSITSKRARENALRTVERMILEMMGKIEEIETPAHAAERKKIDRRWLRRTALQIVSKLPKSCDNSDNGRIRWITTLREQVRRHNLDYRKGTTERTYFRKPIKIDWQNYIQEYNSINNVECATIHEAKGREYDAVCVVIPPDTGGNMFTSQLLTAWENRANSEAKRVIYVGLTRAKKLVTLAIPAVFIDKLKTMLQDRFVNLELHEIDTARA